MFAEIQKLTEAINNQFFIHSSLAGSIFGNSGEKLHIKNMYIFLFKYMFLGCRIRIWNLFLAIASSFWFIKIMY